MDEIADLVALVREIAYPADIECLDAALSGPAFFPGGTGVISSGHAGRLLPHGKILMLAHNFGTVADCATIERQGSQFDTNPTWRHLRRFLGSCGKSVEDCFFTNALMGAMRSDSSEGRVAGHDCPKFRDGCLRVFLKTIALQEPTVVLALGRPAIEFAGESIPALAGWRHFKTFAQIDESPEGPIRQVMLDPQATGQMHPIHFVPLVHPCRRSLNVGKRFFESELGDAAEIAMVRRALSLSKLIH